MSDFKALSAFIEAEVSGIHFPENPANLYDPLRYFMTIGGKRIRPVLTLMSAELFGIDKKESVSAALAIELFHNFSLIHDDIMDEAPVRRGKATIHEKWNRHIAILSGDALFVEAYRKLADYRDDRLADLLTSFNDTATAVCEGQQFDMDFESLSSVTESRYIEMIRLKTSVLLGCALEFGAILGRTELQTRQLLKDFGIQLGIAFQIQDDLLDLYADPEKFGKQVGGDILANKKTLLLLTASRLATAENHPGVVNLLEMPASEEKIEHARSLFTQLGAVEEVEKVMNSYYEQAMDCLEAIPVPDAEKVPLRDLARFLMGRGV